MIGRPITRDRLSLPRLKAFDVYRNVLKSHKDPEPLPSLSRSFNITEALESLSGLLREVLGVREVMLSYVIRDNEIPPMIWAQARPHSTTEAEFNGNIMEKLIEFTPQVGATWAEDNAKVLQIITEIINDAVYASSIKPHIRTCNRRAAYFAPSQHNQGNSRYQSSIKNAEKLASQNC